jgi:glycosyltransferase involved in cell wall biosynthesis
MKKLSIISHFYNHHAMVEKQISYWKSLPDQLKENIEFILVDDCSDDNRYFNCENLNLKMYRIISDIPWNQAGARNLGTFQASGDWALFMDIDQFFYAEPFENLIQNLDSLNKNSMYYFQIKELIDITANKLLSHHPNTFLTHLATFKDNGMYDEDFTGHYGYEDLYLPRVWQKNGGELTLFSNTIYFEDLGFGTQNLNRDLTRNQALAQFKLATGTKNSTSLLRFEWHRI